MIYVHKGKIQIRCASGESDYYLGHKNDCVELIHRDQTNENNSLWKIIQMNLLDLGKEVLVKDENGNHSVQKSIYLSQF